MWCFLVFISALRTTAAAVAGRPIAETLSQKSVVASSEQTDRQKGSTAHASEALHTHFCVDGPSGDIVRLRWSPLGQQQWPPRVIDFPTVRTWSKLLS